MGELSTLHQPKPVSWIERIFERMSCFYGTKFADAWRGVDDVTVKAVWAESLAGYTGEEIKRGLDACLTRDWPPTLPEFLKLCRPPMDLVSAYHEAIAQMRNRNSELQAERDRELWSDASIFWAAVETGSDLTSLSYDKIEKRWQAEITKAKARIASGELSATVPKAPERLPPPERIGMADPKVRAMFADLLDQTKINKDDD